MCERLTYQGDALYHKKSIRNVLRFEISPESILLIGVGIYGGSEEDLFDPEAHITFDRTTTSVSIWSQNKDADNHSSGVELVARKTVIMNTEQSKQLAKLKCQNKIKHAMTVWLDTPILITDNQAYEIEHNVLPTDVEYHYSGWPITTLGAELWTCYGSTNSPLLVSNDITFSFSEAAFKTGRSCVLEGQIPYLMFWKL